MDETKSLNKFSNIVSDWVVWILQPSRPRVLVSGGSKAIGEKLTLAPTIFGSFSN